MNKHVKRIGCGLVILLVVLVVVGVIAVQVVLKDYLGKIFNDKVKPGLEEKMQVKVELGDASVNLVGGSVGVRDVMIGNPKQFKEPILFGLKKFAVDVDLGRLLNFKKLKEGKPDIKVEEVTLKDAELNIIRNADKLINLKVLADTLNAGKKQEPEEDKKKAGKEPEAGTGEEKPAKPVELPPFWLNKLEISTMVRYLDHAIAQDQPLDIGLKMSVEMKNLSTYDVGATGTIAITGHLANDIAMCKTDIKGHIAPLTDPMKPTFDLAGDIGSVDLRLVRPYIQAIGVGCDSLSLRLNIVCTNGVFDSKKSVITLAMTKVVLSGDLAKSMPPGMSYLPELTVPVPIEGPISQPSVNGTKALTSAVLDNIKNNVGGVVKGAIGGLISGDKDKDSKGDASKSLGGLLGGGDKDKKDDSAKKDAPKEGAKDKPKLPGLPF